MKNKKTYQIVTTVIVFLFLVVWMVLWVQKQNSGLKDSTTFSESVVETEIKHVITLLDQEDYSTLQEISTDAMKEYLTEEVWGDARTQFSEDWGTLEKLGTIYLSEAEQDGNRMACGQVKATYENVKVTYTIVFDQEMKIAGLYIQ